MHLSSPLPQHSAPTAGSKPHSATFTENQPQPPKQEKNFFLSNCNVTIINNNYFTPRQQVQQKRVQQQQANWHTLKEIMFK